MCFIQYLHNAPWLTIGWESGLHLSGVFFRVNYSSSRMSVADDQQVEVRGHAARQKVEQTPDRREVLTTQTMSENEDVVSDEKTCGLCIFPLWSHALIPALNWLFQMISPCVNPG